jgi:hypothetical protein
MQHDRAIFEDGRIFLNRTMRIYPAFSGFYGMGETIERIVSFFRHAAQGLEERKQILYLLGPVGGGKSSLAERLKLLMEVHPIFVLKAGDELSPVFESPLGLFDPDSMGTISPLALAGERSEPLRLGVRDHHACSVQRRSRVLNDAGTNGLFFRGFRSWNPTTRRPRHDKRYHEAGNYAAPRPRLNASTTGLIR